MRIVIMGSGAIGSLYGGLLSLAGADVVLLVGRQRHVEAIQKRGLLIHGVMGDHNIDLEASENPAEITDADLVIITTKTYDTLAAASEIKHLTDAGAYVMCLQNGIGTEKLVAEALDTTKVIRGTTCAGALITGPGEITATGRGITELGSHYSENMPMVEQIGEMLTQAGFDVRVWDNIEGVVWTKTIVNCGINPIGALTRMSNGDVYGNEDLRQLIIQLVEEAVKVAQAQGIELTTDDPVRFTLGTAKATGDNINSMLQDILSKKRTEIENITGEVIRLGRELGIETPSSIAVYSLIKAIETRYLGEPEMDAEKQKYSVQDLLEVLTTS